MTLLTEHILTEEEKKNICEWKYAGKYSIYNLPGYYEMAEKKWGFMNPKYADDFHAFYEGKIFVGFVNISPEENEVFIGIGVSPELCGKGYGTIMLESAEEISKRLYPDKPLYLEVRTWNERAINCYKKAGFEIDGKAFEQKTSAGPGMFYRMIKK